MNKQTIFRSAAAVATAVGIASASLPAQAQDHGAMLGNWFQVSGPGGIRLTENGTVQFRGRQEWPMTATECTAGFEHAFQTVNGQALYAELSADAVFDNDGVPIAEGLRGRLPDGDVAVLHSQCFGASEIGSTVYYALVAPDRLLAVAFGDGIYGIDDLQREPPMVPPQSLDQETREAIQSALKALGFYEDEVDGMFGPASRAAVSAFQASLGDEETGILNRYQMDILLGN
ncbi:MAG: peptidoglycan-binding domain-containing protein [Alphaproteobacteria bacterium]